MQYLAHKLAIGIALAAITTASASAATITYEFVERQQVEEINCDELDLENPHNNFAFDKKDEGYNSLWEYEPTNAQGIIDACIAAQNPQVLSTSTQAPQVAGAATELPKVGSTGVIAVAIAIAMAAFTVLRKQKA